MSVHEDLKAYLDGELSPERAAEVRAAIEADPALAQEAQELMALARVLREEAVQLTPVGMEETLRALDRPRSLSWWPVLACGAGLAAAALAFVAVLPRGAAERVAFEDRAAQAKAVVPLDEAERRTKRPSSRPRFSAPATKEKAFKGLVVRPQASEVDEQQALDAAKGAVLPDKKSRASSTPRAADEEIAAAPSVVPEMPAESAPEPPAEKEAQKSAGPRSGEIAVDVDSPAEATREAAAVARSLGGRVSADDRVEGPTKLVVRVPAGSYGEAVRRLRRLGETKAVREEAGGGGARRDTRSAAPAAVGGGQGAAPAKPQASAEGRHRPRAQEEPLATITVTLRRRPAARKAKPPAPEKEKSGTGNPPDESLAPR